jgi:hypothetical protein
MQGKKRLLHIFYHSVHIYIFHDRVIFHRKRKICQAQKEKILQLMQGDQFSKGIRKLWYHYLSERPIRIVFILLTHAMNDYTQGKSELAR